MYLILIIFFHFGFVIFRPQNTHEIIKIIESEREVLFVELNFIEYDETFDFIEGLISYVSCWCFVDLYEKYIYIKKKTNNLRVCYVVCFVSYFELQLKKKKS